MKLGLGLGINKGGYVKSSPQYFAMTIDTTKAGVSNNDQFQFTGAAGQYDVDVVQNDVIVQSYTGLIDEQTITLPAAGLYQVRVYAKGSNPFNKIDFGNAGNPSDKLKVKSIDNFGIIKWNSNLKDGFNGCKNNSNLPNDIEFINQIINGEALFNVNDITIVPENLTFPNLQNGFALFRNTLIDSLPRNMKLPNLTKGDRMFENVTINTDDYSSLIIKMETANGNTGVIFDAGTSKYDSNFSIAEYTKTAGQARADLINNQGWTFKDSGQI